jgi:hypothetical protein
MCGRLFEHVLTASRKQEFKRIEAEIKNMRHLTQMHQAMFKNRSPGRPPISLCRSLFDDPLIELHLDMLAAQQQSDGGWHISWPAISATSELEAGYRNCQCHQDP